MNAADRPIQDMPAGRTAAAMRKGQTVTPPFSPVLLAGLLLRPLPLAPLQPVLNAAMKAIHRRHPEIFERLSCLDEPVYLIDPVDLPFVFILRPDSLRPSLTAMRRSDAQKKAAAWTAVIRGPLMSLIGLLEGRRDGDALFFSRELTIEGDTEAVLALRNAVDGAEVDMREDFMAAFGPLAAPLRRAGDGAGALLALVSRDMDLLRDALIAPAMRRSDAQAAKLRRLEERIDRLGRTRRAAARHAADHR